jgi:hypothetical protein
MSLLLLWLSIFTKWKQFLLTYDVSWSSRLRWKKEKKQRKKEKRKHLVASSIFNSHFYLSTFLFVLSGFVRFVTIPTVRVWFLRFNYLYFHKFSARNPRSKDRSNKKWHQRKNVVLVNGGESEETLFTLSTRNYLTITSLSIRLERWITLYIK